MSLTIHSKYKYFDSTVQGAEDRRQKFHFCPLLFAINAMLNLSNREIKLDVMWSYVKQQMAKMKLLPSVLSSLNS